MRLTGGKRLVAQRTAWAPSGQNLADLACKRLQLLARRPGHEGRRPLYIGLDVVRLDHIQLALLVIAQS